MTTTKADTPAFVNRKIDEKELVKLEKTLEEQMEIANKLGVRGTPSVFDTKGNKVSWVEMLQKYGVKVQ
jgi:thiol:disulfide interchange protein DsbC